MQPILSRTSSTRRPAGLMGYRMGGGLERSASEPEASGTFLLVPCRRHSRSSGVSLRPGGISPFSGKICPSVVVPCSWEDAAEGVDATGRSPLRGPAVAGPQFAESSATTTKRIALVLMLLGSFYSRGAVSDSGYWF